MFETAAKRSSHNRLLLLQLLLLLVFLLHHYCYCTATAATASSTTTTTTTTTTTATTTTTTATTTTATTTACQSDVHALHGKAVQHTGRHGRRSQPAIIILLLLLLLVLSAACSTRRPTTPWAYLPDVMGALKCHQDLLIGEDRTGLLQQYVAKYLAKSASQDWATVLSRYHPMEPEMVLQLFGAKLRQWHFTTVGGGKRDFIVPLPEVADLPEALRERSLGSRPDQPPGLSAQDQTGKSAPG